VLIEGSRTNLLVRSQEFDNASWSKTTGAFTANAMTAPDGTLTADRYAPNVSAALNDNIVQSGITVVSGSTYTYSGYFKYVTGADYPWVEVTTVNPTLRTWINIQTGTLGTAGHTSPIVRSLANGWVYFSVTFTANSTSTQTYVSIRPGDNDAGTIVSTGAAAYSPWGFQVELGAFPSSYVPTTSAAATRASDVLTYTAGVSAPFGLWAESDASTIASDGSTIVTAFQAAGPANNRVSVRANQGGNGVVFVSSGGSLVATLVNSGLISSGIEKHAARAELNNFNAARNGALATLDTAGAAPASIDTIKIGQVEDGTTGAFRYIRRIAVFNSALTDAQLQTTTS
jgi:hypothetical protein